MQLEFFDVPSPCIDICQSDEKGYCRGCMRSRDERQNWKNLHNDEKKKVIRLCIQRKKRKDNPRKAKGIQTPVVQEQENDAAMQPSLLDDPPSNISTSQKNALDFSEFEL